MVQILGPEERKASRRAAARTIRRILLLILVILGAGIIYFSYHDRSDSGTINAKGKLYNYRFEFRDLRNIQKVELYLEGRLFTAYCYNEHLKKPVLFPVVSSSGKIVTRGYPLDPRPFEPADHPHHIGIWFAHGVVNNLDFWSNTDSVPDGRKFHYGTIRHKEFAEMKSGDEEGVLNVNCTWDRPDGRTLMDENSTFTFSANENIRFIDRTTTLTARDIGVLFQDSKEGMYCIRVAREMEQPSEEGRDYLDENLNLIPASRRPEVTLKGMYANSEGQTGDEVWGKRARWVVLSSEMSGDPVSIMMFDHPENPNYPSHWMARGYGLFGINPFGSAVYSEGKESLNFFLKPGESVTFRYRIVVTDGEKPANDKIESLFNDFSENQ